LPGRGKSSGDGTSDQHAGRNGSKCPRERVHRLSTISFAGRTLLVNVKLPTCRLAPSKPGSFGLSRKRVANMLKHELQHFTFAKEKTLPPKRDACPTFAA
jgi:hypothetical protein